MFPPQYRDEGRITQVLPRLFYDLPRNSPCIVVPHEPNFLAFGMRTGI